MSATQPSSRACCCCCSRLLYGTPRAELAAPPRPRLPRKRKTQRPQLFHPGTAGGSIRVIRPAFQGSSAQAGRPVQTLAEPAVRLLRGVPHRLVPSARFQRKALPPPRPRCFFPTALRLFDMTSERIIACW